MTRDAFYKAEEIMNDLHTIFLLQGVFTNATLARDEEYHAGHNERIRNDNVRLCYLQDANDYTKLEKFIVGNRETIIGASVCGKDIPIELVEEIESVISKYEQKLNKELEELSADYIDEE